MSFVFFANRDIGTFFVFEAGTVWGVRTFVNLELNTEGQTIKFPRL
jgi:hypothetical protein